MLDLLFITLGQIARWPTRWHPSFAPNRSVTCRTILCASVISTIEEMINLPEVSHRCAHHLIRPMPISSATPTS
ncbi:BZ3500_MvSof-1268-A1-R1_Chr1-2g01298 [Microbotryum saponariae]|uniref:BZ3500_MvSof-1268-A1-R1_Chr1-2g01298 protein n=1 Tax=Microbotryum saponariae TaxID=289078 RepID=A0A2X0KE64_9BASI|nr:BZ3500_MvSof-1268-A1-R1_Chr1-2g01298 [Microbotryum saponariae]SCZ97012.1 BZ3501_MvSof-1269-A2-R1_Chr1-2g00896 [Microbotryum saponariae]